MSSRLSIRPLFPEYPFRKEIPTWRRSVWRQVVECCHCDATLAIVFANLCRSICVCLHTSKTLSGASESDIITEKRQLDDVEGWGERTRVSVLYLAHDSYCSIGNICNFHLCVMRPNRRYDNRTVFV